MQKILNFLICCAKILTFLGCAKNTNFSQLQEPELKYFSLYMISR